MSSIRINAIMLKNYRSFGKPCVIKFPDENYKKPISIVGYNNAGKTNLLNAILYGVTERYVSANTFSINDFHNRDYDRIPNIVTKLTSSEELKANGKNANLTGYHFLDIELDGYDIVSATINSYEDGNKNEKNWQAFGASKYFKIFYINFHEIKKEIATKKTSWGNLSSFLAKHIKKLVDEDTEMAKKKVKFKSNIQETTDAILENSKLKNFIERIQKNYTINLRENNCKIEFGLPEYEDIFLEMMFKIGLNGDEDNLVPIDHFGDGYISMFVMAVIKAIAEDNSDDKCLFVFEEPESFLHENHQEYFYKTVLCSLSEAGHQVIYTTHSYKMMDIFDTKGLVRLEFDDVKKETVLKYNNCENEFMSRIQIDKVVGDELISEIDDYNNYIKIIEPNLNKIIFSKKVILVEGPNDLMVYKHIIKKKVLEISNDEKYAETYLNFKNISIIPHHGKITAIVLIRLCKHLGIDFFVINDFDFEEDFTSKLDFETEEEYKQSNFYNNEIQHVHSVNLKGESHSLKTKKAMITTNWKLLNEAKNGKLHFNVPKLEKVIGYDSNDKDSTGIWNKTNSIETFSSEIFPEKLSEFLEIEKSSKATITLDDLF